jgi:hypothetical protein
MIYTDNWEKAQLVGLKNGNVDLPVLAICPYKSHSLTWEAKNDAMAPGCRTSVAAGLRDIAGLRGRR